MNLELNNIKNVQSNPPKAIVKNDLLSIKLIKLVAKVNK